MESKRNSCSLVVGKQDGIQSLWKADWQFLVKLNILVTYDLAKINQTPWYLLKGLKKLHPNICTWMFIGEWMNCGSSRQQSITQF